MKVIGYIRVSTEEQARGGVSLDAQRRQMDSYCATHEYELVRVESDPGHSGLIEMKKRQGSAKAIAALEAGEASGLLVWKLDRLGRRALDVVSFARDCEKNGWHFMSVTDHIDTTTPMGKFVLHMLAALAEMESGRLGERVQMGMRELVMQKRAGSFVTPFGWRFADGHWRPKARKGEDPDKRELVANEEEQVLLHEILEMRDKGLGAYRVAKALNAEQRFSPRTGRPWHANSVEAITKTARRHQKIREAG